jgi:DNA-binding PadR family transcriptional regulator
MNAYEKYQKEYLKKYFHTEDGREHLKQAQKKYRKSEQGVKKNTEMWMRWYNRKKEFNNEVSRLMAIDIF